MSTSFKRLTGHDCISQSCPLALFSVDVTRRYEASASLQLASHALMQRAGLAIAQFAIAVAPHAHRIWIACGPGNNGGDGFEAAIHLKAWGKEPIISLLADSSANRSPADALHSRKEAEAVGIFAAENPPDKYDLCIDALFGSGSLRPFDLQCTEWISRINTGQAPVVAIDVPSGLNAQTGLGGASFVKADFTLSLLTAKPGLFTGDGRDASGEVWLHGLGMCPPANSCAELTPSAQHLHRLHNSHKGIYGDVGIIGGDTGMVGAALLAALGALYGGAGRVYVGVLDSQVASMDTVHPELMFRAVKSMDFGSFVVVAGCGGGPAIHSWLPEILNRAKLLVLDADALNAIAMDSVLQGYIMSRKPGTTVLTPHPLEAARLMGISSEDVQADRLSCAQAIANRYSCVVALKGSGTVIAAPHRLPRVNITGNPQLATAGTGDVLAGLVGAYLALGMTPFDATSAAVHRHGLVADRWTGLTRLTAHELASSL